MRAALGRPTGEPFQPTDRDRDAMEAALRGLPSHGWTAGHVRPPRPLPCWCCPNSRGCRIGTSPPSPPATSHIADGVATIRSAAGEWTIGPADDAVLCGPCAVVRWLKILDLAVTKPSTKTIARALKKAAVVDHRSPHVCHDRAGPR